jgi:hypothetical protein
MTAQAFALGVWFEQMCACFKCGVPIVVPASQVSQFRQKGETFYCVNGHGQVFRETDIKKLERQLEAEKQRAERERGWRLQAEEREASAKRSAATYKGKVTAIRNRVGNGVCPCCRRTFVALQRHMATKHPDYKADEK